MIRSSQRRSYTRYAIYFACLCAFCVLWWLSSTLSVRHSTAIIDNGVHGGGGSLGQLQNALDECEVARRHFAFNTLQILHTVGQSDTLHLDERRRQRWKHMITRLRKANVLPMVENFTSPAIRARLRKYAESETLILDDLNAVEEQLQPASGGGIVAHENKSPAVMDESADHERVKSSSSRSSSGCTLPPVHPFFRTRRYIPHENSPFRSRLPTQHELDSESARVIVEDLLKEKLVHYRRKQWEFVFIVRALQASGKLKHGRRALVFAAGREPLISFVASKGVDVLATDLDEKNAKDKGWVATHQHADNLLSLHRPEIIEREEFLRRVTFRTLDMNFLHADLYGQFDFIWSTCSLEHVGSIRLGQRFFLNSLMLLKPGGLAIHTVEFNVGNMEKTIEEGGTVLWRKADVEELIRDIRLLGFGVTNVNYYGGESDFDLHVDKPPYGDHLKLAIDCFASTSVGIIAYRRMHDKQPMTTLPPQHTATATMAPQKLLALQGDELSI